MQKTRILATAALALTGLWGAASAHATNVSWSVTIGSSGPVFPAPAVIHPAPVIVQQAPVLVTYPHPGYRPPHRIYAPHPHPHYRYHHRPGRPAAWDRDGDGIPNRADRVYNPRWDRDGDGVPNGRDRFDRNPRRH